MERCVGCRTSEGPVCPRCAGLLEEPIEVRRSLLLPACFGVLGLLLLALCLAMAVTYSGAFRAGLVIGCFLVFGIQASAWSVRNLRKPWRVELGDALDVRWFPWRQVRLPITEVMFGAGVLDHRRTGIRFRLDDVDYPEAESLRRALRVRIALRR